MAQTKNSFDKETVKKIGKSFLWSALTALVAGGTAYQQTLPTGSYLAIGIGVGVTFVANIIHEYTKGSEG